MSDSHFNILVFVLLQLFQSQRIVAWLETDVWSQNHPCEICWYWHKTIRQLHFGDKNSRLNLPNVLQLNSEKHTQLRPMRLKRLLNQVKRRRGHQEWRICHLPNIWHNFCNSEPFSNVFGDHEVWLMSGMSLDEFWWEKVPSAHQLWHDNPEHYFIDLTPLPNLWRNLSLKTLTLHKQNQPARPWVLAQKLTHFIHSPFYLGIYRDHDCICYYHILFS